MLKAAASLVLARHSRLIISVVFTGVPCFVRHGVNRAPVRKREEIRTLPAHRLAGAHKRGALSSSRRAPPCSSPHEPRCGPVRGEARVGSP